MQRLTFWFLCMAVWGCTDNKVPSDTSSSGEDDSGPSADSSDPIDSGRISDTGNDADADADTDADADADADADEGPTGCTSDDLIFDAEIRNEAGMQIYTGYASDSAHLWAKVTNPCSEPVPFTTTTACLVEEWEAVKDGITNEGTFPCFGSETSRTVASNSHIEQEVMPLHDLTIGTYTFTITFGYRPTSGSTRTEGRRAEAEVSFAVVSR
jgi:hypothetical protein